MMLRSAWALPVTLLLAGAPTAYAQTSAPQPVKTAPAAVPPKVGADPQTTTASYGDWVLRCVQVSEGTVSRKLCEVTQSIQVQGQPGPIAQLAFGRVGPKEPMRLTLVLPNNVQLTDTPMIGTSAADAQPVKLTWRRCLPGGCFADVEPSEALTQRLRTVSGVGQIHFKDGTGQDLAFPLSFTGLAQALDALAKN